MDVVEMNRPTHISNLEPTVFALVFFYILIIYIFVFLFTVHRCTCMAVGHWIVVAMMVVVLVVVVLVFPTAHTLIANMMSWVSHTFALSFAVFFFVFFVLSFFFFYTRFCVCSCRSDRPHTNIRTPVFLFVIEFVVCKFAIVFHLVYGNDICVVDIYASNQVTCTLYTCTCGKFNNNYVWQFNHTYLNTIMHMCAYVRGDGYCFTVRFKVRSHDI